MTASLPDPGAPAPRLVLASASPRRAQLLRAAGYAFEIVPAEFDEDAVSKGLLPAELASLLATEKARAVGRRFPEAVVLGADTVVAFGDQPLGKPADADAARRMLQLLSGTTHIVITGIALVHQSRQWERVRTVMSAVKMRALAPGEIDHYVAGGQWEGKAGGYSIQDHDPFVTKMSGSHSNIVGLPMEATRRMLAEAGIEATG